MPKRDPITGQFLPASKRRAAARTALSSASAWLRGNPTRKKRRPAKAAKRKVTRAPKRRTAKRRTRR